MRRFEFHGEGSIASDDDDISAEELVELLNDALDNLGAGRATVTTSGFTVIEQHGDAD